MADNDIDIANFRAPSIDLRADLRSIQSLMRETISDFEGLPPIPVRAAPTVGRGSSIPGAAFGFGGGVTPPPAPSGTLPGQIATAGGQVYGFRAPHGSVAQAAEWAYQDRVYDGWSGDASGAGSRGGGGGRRRGGGGGGGSGGGDGGGGTPGFRDGDAGPGVGGNVSRQLTGFTDLADRLGTTQGPDAIAERFRRFVAGAGIAFGGAKAIGAGLSAFGALEARGRAEERGDLDALVKSDQSIRDVAGRIPIVGELATAIRQNVLDRADNAAIEKTAFETTKIDERTDRAKRRADDLKRGFDATDALADRFEGRVERTGEQRDAKELEDLRKAYDDTVRKSTNPGNVNSKEIKANLERARQAYADRRADIQIERDRSEHDHRSRANELYLRATGDTDAARLESTSRGIEAERREAYRESNAAGVRFDRDIAPNRFAEVANDIGRQRLGEAGQSQQAVFDSLNEVKRVRLRLAGETEAAELELFRDGWDKKVEAARVAVETENDVIKKGQRQREADALGREREAADREFTLRQGQRAELAADASAGNVRASGLRAAGNTDLASEAEFEEGWRQRIEGTNDNVRRSQLVAERDAARSERAAGKARDRDRLAGENRERGLRLEGRDGTAAALQIERQTRERLREAEGDPERQRQIIESAKLDVRDAQQRLVARGPNRGEILRDFANADLTNRAADRGRESAVLEGLLRELITETKRRRPAVAG